MKNKTINRKRKQNKHIQHLFAVCFLTYLCQVLNTSAPRAPVYYVTHYQLQLQMKNYTY